MQTNMVIRISCCLLLSLAACTAPTDQAATPATTPAAAAAPTPAGPRATSYAGEYNWGDPKRQQAGGNLTVYPESDSAVLVYFDISNGPAAFHLGSPLQRAIVRQGTARGTFQNELAEKQSSRVGGAHGARQRGWLIGVPTPAGFEGEEIEVTEPFGQAVVPVDAEQHGVLNKSRSKTPTPR